MKLRSRFWSACMILAVMSTAQTVALAAVTVTPISFIPETITGDGSAVFGVSGADIKRWTSAGGVTTIAQFPAGSSQRHVTDASADGSIIVGRYNPTTLTTSPWYWTSATGFQTINATITTAARVFVSGDGSIVVGDTFTFTPPSTVTTTLDQPRALSYDGSHIGLAFSGGVGRMRVNGVQQTFTIPGDTSNTRVTGFSHDGQIAYGYTTAPNAFRYDASTGVATSSPLSSLWNVNEWSEDGRLGVGSPSSGSNLAMIRLDGQDHLLSTYLTNAGIDVSTLPALNSAYSVTNDGTQFLAGNIQAAVLVTIPEPASLAVLLLPAAGLLYRRHRGASR